MATITYKCGCKEEMIVKVKNSDLKWAARRLCKKCYYASLPQGPWAKVINISGYGRVGAGVDYITDSFLFVFKSFDIKDSLKALGFRYNGEKKGWYVPAERADEVHTDLESLGVVFA